MKKLILTSLTIVSFSLFFILYIKGKSHPETPKDAQKIKDIHLAINTPKPKEEKNLDLNTSIKMPKEISIEKKRNPKKKSQYLAYLNYRKDFYKIKEKKMTQYLSHQKELQHIRKGGVKSELQQEKRKQEVQFQHQYKSIMMSQKGEIQENFIQQKRGIERKREQMHSLQDKQQLQTKYRGEL
jgi:hypothetical protein